MEPVLQRDEKELVPRTRFERLRDVIVGVIGCGLSGWAIWGIYRQANGDLGEFFWTPVMYLLPVFIVGAVLVCRGAVARNKRELTKAALAQRAVEAQTQAAQARAAAIKQDEFWRPLHALRRRWYIRYPVGAGLIALLWYWVSSGDLRGDSVINWIFLVGIGGFALWQIRELAVVALVVGGLFWIGSALSDLSVPGAIILGAVLISLAIYYGLRERE